MASLRTVSVALGLVFMATSATLGERIDLRLDVTYAGASPSAGGTWKLFAKTDESGLFSLRAPLSGVSASITNELPRGRVNGSATDNAGFSTFVNQSVGSARELFFGQQVTPSGSGQQGLFYGVGTLDSGSPNFPGKLAGTTSLGPNITTLTSVQDVPWGLEDSLWSTGVTVASGVFSAGMTPGFSTTSGTYQGSLFTSVGGITTPGATTLDVLITTAVRTNLTFGVANGDYNSDGLVDAADYTVWRDSLDDSVTAFTGADGNGDGTINGADHSVWAANYGASNLTFATAVPEPASVLSLSASLLLAAVGGTARGQDCAARR